MICLALALASTLSFSQSKPTQISRRPAFSAPVIADPQPTYQYFSIMNGSPRGLELHHDTVAGTGQPVDVIKFNIELQVMNSDGNPEPEGLIIDHFFTAKAVRPGTAPNPRDGRDCAFWNYLVLGAENNRDPKLRTWPYVEFIVAQGARTIQTNEDGTVYWSDDIECWGSTDRFRPF